MGQYHIGEAIKGMVSKSNLKNGVRAVQIEEVWEKLMGKKGVFRMEDMLNFDTLIK